MNCIHVEFVKNESHSTMTSDLTPASSMASSSNSPGSQERIQNLNSTSGISVIPSESPAVEESVKSSVPGVKERYDNIVKQEKESNEYRGLLLTNRMKVLLVSHPAVYRSAAALQFQVGAYSDPDDIPGLAHFCEHMVFLGTEKYPEENVFQKYISEHGGENNGITVADSTIFYFEVGPAHLEKALDIFAQFFISPLFTESATTREINAVNSEHESNVASDSRRLFNLRKHIADPTHPFKKFTTGNKETLKTIPESKGIDVRKELLKFHEKWYSSNIMSLVVYGKESLDELEAMVVPLFSTIKDKSVTAPSWPLNPIPLELRRKKIYGVPIKDSREITVDFAIPSQSKHYKSKPANYLTHLITHHGPGSLLSVLKKRGWCNSIYSYDLTPARGFAFFYIGVSVTNEGMNHTDDIVSLIFQYLAMLKKEGPQQWLWEEQRHLMELQYHLNSKSGIDLVQEYAPLLQQYPMEDILTIENLKTEWKPELITDLLSLLTPDNAVVTIFAKAFEEKCTMTDQWYETKYGYEDIDESTLKTWKEVQPSEELHLPPPNEFIPATLTPGKEAVPAIVKDTKLMRLWYKKETYRDAELIFRLVSPMIDAEPLNCYLCGLWLDLVVDRLQEVTYGAALAGMKWKVHGDEDGINITVEGFEEKINILLYKIIDQVVGFKADPKRFQVLRADFYSSLENDTNDTQPIELAVEEEKACLSAWYLSASGPQAKELVKRKANQENADLTLEQLDAFAASVIRKVHIESFIRGDISREKALSIADSVEEKFPKDGIPLLAAQLLPNRSIELDKGAWYVRKIITEVNRESCASIYYACGVSEMRGKLVLKLLLQLLQEPCYTTLRTQEQLGYSVYANFVSYTGAHGLRISVQGERHPEFLDQRIEEFVQNFSVYNFERRRLEEEKLKEITKEDLITFYKKYLSQDSPDRAKLSIYVISIAEGGAGEEDSKTEEKQKEYTSQENDKEEPLNEESPDNVEPPINHIITTEENNTNKEDLTSSRQKQEENATQNQEKPLNENSLDGVEEPVNPTTTEEKDANKEDMTPSKPKLEENALQNIVKEKSLSEGSPGDAEQSVSVITTEEKDANKEDITSSKQKQEENAVQNKEKPLSEESSGGAGQSVSAVTTEEKYAKELMAPKQKQEKNVTQNIDKEKPLSEDSPGSTEQSICAVTTVEKNAIEEDKKEKPLSEDSTGVTELSISLNITLKIGNNKEDFKPAEQKVRVAQKGDKTLVEPEIATNSTVKVDASGGNFKPAEQEQVIQITQKSEKIQLELKIITDSAAKGVVSEGDFKPAEQQQEDNVTQETDKVLQQPEIITDLLEFKSRRRLYPNPTPFMNIPRKGL